MHNEWVDSFPQLFSSKSYPPLKALQLQQTNTAVLFSSATHYKFQLEQTLSYFWNYIYNEGSVLLGTTATEQLQARRAKHLNN